MNIRKSMCTFPPTVVDLHHILPPAGGIRRREIGETVLDGIQGRTFHPHVEAFWKIKFNSEII
jgi:hypothetical protein